MYWFASLEIESVPHKFDARLSARRVVGKLKMSLNELSSRCIVSCSPLISSCSNVPFRFGFLCVSLPIAYSKYLNHITARAAQALAWNSFAATDPDACLFFLDDATIVPPIKVNKYPYWLFPSVGSHLLLASEYATGLDWSSLLYELEDVRCCQR